MKSCSTRLIQNPHNKLLWLTSLLALLLMLSAIPGEAAVRATLDRDTVYAGGTLTLTIENDGRQSGLQPNLAPLQKNFDVLGTSTSTQVSILNGRRSDKTLWQVQLQPRRTGRLSIPPISVGGQQTLPLELRVTEAPQQATAQTGQHVFIEAGINPASKQIYVQQQIPYTVHLYYDGRLQEGEIIAPKLQHAVVEQLGEDKSYNAERNGHSYNVIERHYVISPEKSGSLHIPPATFSGRIAVPQQRGRSSRPGNLTQDFFGNSPFANDPFFRNSLLSSRFFGAGSEQPVTARSRPINIDIKPRPVTAGGNWLPAEAVTLSDSWTENPPQFKAGEPVSRTISIQTKGLSGSQIPELAIATPTDVHLYPETPKQESRTDGTTIYGVRTQTLTYIPDTSGTLDIPAITLNWWDTRHNKAASTTLPAWQFKVLPGAAGSTSEAQASAHNPAVQHAAPTRSAGQVAQTDVGSGLLEILFQAIKTNGLWLITASGLLLTLLLVMMARRTKRHHPVDARGTAIQAPQHAQPDLKSVLRDLQKACAINDRQAAASALLKLAQAHWPDAPPRSLDALAARIENGQAQLRELDHSLYAADASHWEGTALWNEFRRGLEIKKTARHHSDDGLNPLYPQHS